jgi:hypothetical protein
MKFPVVIGGRTVELGWDMETAKRFTYRLKSIGGHPTQRELIGKQTQDVAFTKILWALLPSAHLCNWPSPEDLFVAIDQDTEAKAIAEAVVAIYAEMSPPAEKKSTLRKSPSPGSSSD